MSLLGRSLNGVSVSVALPVSAGYIGAWSPAICMIPIKSGEREWSLEHTRGIINWTVGAGLVPALKGNHKGCPYRTPLPPSTKGGPSRYLNPYRVKSFTYHGQPHALLR